MKLGDRLQISLQILSKFRLIMLLSTVPEIITKPMVF